MRSLTIDEKSISAALAGQIDLDSMINDLSIPDSTIESKCVELDDNGYMLSREFQPGDALLTISLEPDGPLASLSISARQEALGRIMRCTTRLITGRSRSIPVSWRAFHYKNRLSFQADRRLRREDGGKTDAGRVILELNQENGPVVFAFMLDREGRQDLSNLHPNLGLLKKATSGVGKALTLPEKVKAPAVLGSSLALDSDLPERTSPNVLLDEWYDVRLTSAQRQFVDYPMNGSIRLVGPAGSGKTIALVVKCLHELIQAQNGQTQKRFLFLTHAASTVTEVENMTLSMAPEKGLEILASDRPSLVITTLYSLANLQMRYDLDDLTPVSLDGYEGRTFQADILNAVIEDYKNGDWVAFRSGCSSPFVAYMEAQKNSPERRFFLWELLNEFACVLDAEGIRSGIEQRSKYLSDKRKSWMMVLESREEREVVLALYDKFRSWLRNERAIGTDQMITDFLNYLDSFRWEATREKEGFDAVFVDELHLFSRQERLIFRHLMRNPITTPTVLMAYDAKQSPRDTFLSLPSGGAQKYDFWKDARLGKVDKIELVDVFRYTPQIAKALLCIDQSFPGQDLDDDWPAYSGVSRTEDGPVPTICALNSTLQTYTTVFKRAKEIQRKLGRGRRVVVLCASNDLFLRHLEYKSFREDFCVIASRDDVSGIASSTKKFIFSMPEFVAGLQFDTVLLIEVNRGEVPDGPYSSATLRKFASQVYLGASRAERHLELYSSSEHGGIAPIISPAVLEGAIRKVEVNGLLEI